MSVAIVSGAAPACPSCESAPEPSESRRFLLGALSLIFFEDERDTSKAFAPDRRFAGWFDYQPDSAGTPAAYFS